MSLRNAIITQAASSQSPSAPREMIYVLAPRRAVRKLNHPAAAGVAVLLFGERKAQNNIA